MGLFAWLIVLVVGCANPNQNLLQERETITNPVLPGDRPDPTVVKIGDTYWASATSNEWSPLFPIFKSHNLEDWELVTYVFPEGAPDWAVNNFWAPELAYDEKQQKVYVYYTARDKISNRLSVAVASANSPEGPFTDHGPLVAQELGSIDAYEVRDEAGKLYMLWKEDGNSRGVATPIWAQEINEDRTELRGEMHELFRNDAEWEGNLVEGVSIFRNGGYYYATYSAGGCCETTCNYKTGVARAKKLLGPWEKYSGNPVLVDNEEWKCAGHGTVIEKNDDLYLLYHAYHTKGSVFVGREGVLEKMVWNEDGWPDFKNISSYNRSKATLDYQDRFLKTLDPVWQWRVTENIQYETGSEGLLLGASMHNSGLGSLLVQPTRSPDYHFETTINVKNSGKEAEGGLALIGAAHNGFGAPIAAMGISTGGSKVKVWQNIEGNILTLGEVNLPEEIEEVDLKMEVEDGHKLTFSWGNSENMTSLVNKKDASHLVPWGMGFRLGLISKGQASEKVNFKRVKIENHQYQ